jgi:hypothetical protein
MLDQKLCNYRPYFGREIFFKAELGKMSGAVRLDKERPTMTGQKISLT